MDFFLLDLPPTQQRLQLGPAPAGGPSSQDKSQGVPNGEALGSILIQPPAKTFT